MRTAVNTSLLVCAVLGAMARTASAGDDVCLPDRAVIRLAPGATIGDVLATHGGAVLASVPSRGIFLLDVPDGISENDYILVLAADPRVLVAECDLLVNDPNPDPGTQDIFFASTLDAYRRQPALDAIGLDGAQQLATGCGVVVAVLDTGLDPAHPVFAGRIAQGAVNLLTGGADVSDSGDGVDNNGNGLTDEAVAHGTLAAGLVLRVAPDALVLPIKLMSSDGESSSFLVVAGIYHAVDSGAHVINASLGTFGSSQLLIDAASEATAAGVTVVASAGNDGNLKPVRNPAGLSALGVVAVAAVDDAGVRTAWSNYGPHVSIVGPGVDVTSAVPGGQYGAASGTSFAAPMAAGVLALLREACPGAAPDALVARMLGAADPIDALNPGFEGWLGTGRLDAAAALGAPGAAPLPCRADVNADGRVDIEDLYAVHAAPVDITFDGVVNDEDLRALARVIRAGELRTMGAGRR